MKRQALFAALWLVLLAVVAFAYRWQLDLGFTDTDGLADVAAGANPFVYQLTMPLLDGVGGANANFYRPVVNLQNWALYRLFGWEPLGWQVWGLALHLACVLLVGRVARAAGYGQITSFVAGVLAGLHPLGVEVVPAVARNIDLLLAAFTLGAFWALLRGRWLLASGLALASIGCKETGLAMLPLMGWLAWKRGGRGAAARLVGPWVVLVPAFLIVRQQVLAGLGGYRESALDPAGFERILRSATLELLLPALSGPFEQLFTDWPSQLGCGIAATVVLGIGAWHVRRDPVALGALAAAVSPLLIYGLTNVYGRRLLYLPMLGIALFLARLLTDLQLRWVVVVLAAAMVPASALVHGDRDWALNDRVTASVIAAEEQLAALPPGSSVWLVDRCVYVYSDPLRASYWREGVGQSNCVGSYALQAWADDVLGDGHVQFERFTLTRPQSELGPAQVRVEGQELVIERPRHGRTVHKAARRHGFRIEDEGDSLRVRSPEGRPGEHLLVLGGDRAQLVQVP